MNLIEKLGGYGNAKKFSGFGMGSYIDPVTLRVKHSNDSSYAGEFVGLVCCRSLSKELLEYRRANNIFEEGDSVLYKSIGDGHVHKYSKLTEFKYDLRHATDIEIAQGYRS